MPKKRTKYGNVIGGPLTKAVKKPAAKKVKPSKAAKTVDKPKVRTRSGAPLDPKHQAYT